MKKIKRNKGGKNMKKVKCKQCDGYYVLKSGKFGKFVGCSNFPDCKSTLKIYEWAFEYIKEFGINLYSWDRICWKCGKTTKVYSYFLNYDLEELDEYFSWLDPIGLGDIETLDKFLSTKYHTIRKMFSKTVSMSYFANTCEHCGALQGRFFIVEDPHEIMSDLFNHNMDRYFIENIPYEKVKIPLEEIKKFFTYC